MADNDSLISTQDFILEFVNIMKFDGSVLNIKNLIIEFNLYEDLFGGTITGDLLINDSNDLITSLSLSGNEYISFNLIKPLYECSVSKVMKIYSIGKRLLSTDTNENYVIHFCSEELLLSEQHRVSKSYKNKKVSDIVRDVCENYLNINTSKSLNSYPLRIDDTKNTLDLVVPNLKPLEAIFWASTYAQFTPISPSTFLFYQNREGFNFKSLDSLYTLPEYQTYRYEPKNIPIVNDSNYESNYRSVISYEILKHFNTINSITDGAFSSKLISVDLLSQNYIETIFDYSESSKYSKKLNEFGVLTNAKNSSGETINRTPGSLKLVTGISASSKSPYVISKNIEIKDVQVEKTIQNRMSNLSILNSTRLKLVLPGDPLLTVGKTIIFNLPNVGLHDGKQLDSYYSGKYLITAVRHKTLQTGAYQTILEICKESIPTPYGNYRDFNGTLASIGL